MFNLKAKPDQIDFLAGFSVALVILPQSLAYAQLAGLPPRYGLFAAALPLIVFSMFASSPYLQTGPVALTSLLTFGVLTSANYIPESTNYIGAAALLALFVGIFRILLGSIKGGWIAYLISQPVLQGFTGAAAIIIMSSQLPKALGNDLVVPDGSILNQAFWAIKSPESWNFYAISISIFTIIIMFSSKKIHKLFPGVLFVSALGIIFVTLEMYNGSVVGDSNEVSNELPSLFTQFNFSQSLNLLIGAIIIAIVGFAEPSAIARTYANEEKSIWNVNRELIASGLANITSALNGSFPVGGSFSRSSLNRVIGAKSQWSGAITGATVLIFLPFASILNHLPQAVLGAIVIGAAIKLFKPKGIIAIFKSSMNHGFITSLTFILTLALSPNIHYALIAGMIATFVLNYLDPASIKAETENDTIRIRVKGLIWHQNTTKLLNEIVDEIKLHKSKSIIIDFSNSPGIEHSFINQLEELATGKDIQLTGL